MKIYAKETKTQFWGLFLITVSFAGVNGASSYFSKIIIDMVNSKASIHVISVVCLVIIFVYLIISIFSILKTYLQVKISNDLDYGVKGYYFNIVQKSTYISNMEKESSEIYYRMFHDIGLMSKYYINLVITFPSSLIAIALYIGIMTCWSYKLMLFVVAISIIQIVVAHINKPHIQKNTAIVIQNENQFVKEVGEHFRGIEIIKTLGLEEYKLSHINKTINKIKKSKQKSALVLSILNFITGFIGQIGSVGILLVGSMLIYGNEITIGTYIGFGSIMVLFGSTINSLVALINDFEEVKVSYLRYREYCDSYCDYEYEGELEFNFERTLEFKNMSFGYIANKEIFKNVNTQFKSGEFIGIVGPSGSGKSTFGKLIMRLLKPTDGEILIDGNNIRKFDHKTYKSKVAYLSQSPFIFSGTIKENICIGNKTYDEDYFQELLSKTGVMDIVERCPEGLETRIGKEGMMLSVGESQRISIARTLLKKPSIVILDEPTSALNKKLEDLVVDLFKEYVSEYRSLVFLISHKESTLKKVDCIFAIDIFKQLDNFEEEEIN